MKGLLLKDFYMTVKYCKSFAVIVAVFLILSLFGNSNMFFICYPMVIVSMIPVSLISYDDREKWDVYAGTLPYTGKQIVQGKYLTGLIWTGVMMLSIGIFQMVRMLVMGNFDLSVLGFILEIVLVIGVTAPALQIPLIYKFGIEKGRILNMGIIIIFCVVCTLLMQNNEMVELAEITAAIAGQIPIGLVMVGLPLAALAVYGISYTASAAIYEGKKDKKHQKSAQI